MANFDVLKNFIKQRVYTNGTQAITGQVMQDTLLEMLKAWGYQFQGFATPETVPPATANDYKPYYLANARGTYTNFGGAVLDGSTLAMLYYDGSWKSQVLTMGGGGGTGNFVTLNTEQTISGAKTFSSPTYFAGKIVRTITEAVSTDLSKIPNDTAIVLQTGSGNSSDSSAWLWRLNWAASNYGIFWDDIDDNLFFVGNGKSRLQLNLTDGGVTVGGVTVPQNITAAKFITSGGKASQFVKGDGSLDNNTYLTTTAASTGYVTLNTTQTITGLKTLSNNSWFYENVLYGSNATGSFWRDASRTKIMAGVGCFTINSDNPFMYMGWGEKPWDESKNFCVSSSFIKYKNNTVWHAGNDGLGSGLNADLLDGIHANGLFTALSNSGNYISMTIGGTTKTLTPAYASNAGQLGGNAPSYYATASGYVKKTGDTMSGTLTLDTIMSSAPYLTFSTQLYIGNATDTNNTVNQGSIRTIGGISAALSIWAGKNITASGEVTAISDIRTKSDIRSLTFRGGIRPVSFIKDGKRGIGFIAQEVQKLYPELVVEGADGLLSLNYAGYTAVLQSQVDNHETELQRLRGRVEELERRNEELSRKSRRLDYGK